MVRRGMWGRVWGLGCLNLQLNSSDPAAADAMAALSAAAEDASPGS